MENFVLNLFSINSLPLVLGVVIALLLIFLAKAHLEKRNPFNLEDLVTNDITGKVSLNKFGQLVSLIVSSWGFLYLTVHGNLSETYFATYMACWAGFTAINKAIDVHKLKVDNDATKEDNISEESTLTIKQTKDSK